MDPSSKSERAALDRANALAGAHARFARATIAIYGAAAVLAFGLLVSSLLADKSHEEGQVRERLLLETELGAHSLAGHLGRLGGELRRLGTRSEVDLFDQNLAPEQSLLELSHERSSFFNLGVALVDTEGKVVYGVPHTFLAKGSSFSGEAWFLSAKMDPSTRIEPMNPERPDSVVYVISPIVRSGRFSGLLLGGIDVARDGPIADRSASSDVETILATRDGVVIFPPVAPAFAGEGGWKELFTSATPSFTEVLKLGGKMAVVTASPVTATDFRVLSVGWREALYRPARQRLVTRFFTGLALATVPLVLFVFLFTRSLRVFKKNEEAAVREERMRLLGEASSSIAHEVRNALNGLSMGLELVVRPGEPERQKRILSELRTEIARLSGFTTRLMTFSRGIEPRTAELDLAEFLPKVTGLMKDNAEEHGTALELTTPDGPVRVVVDAALLHVAVSNLVHNALDSVAQNGPDKTPRVSVSLSVLGKAAAIRVADNGRGVPREVRAGLFEPFQSGKPNGVGIGLALSRKIAEAHGGAIVLEATDVGASFLLTIPLEAA